MHFAEYKTILSANNNMNVYRGCSHGCIYCDSRSKCYQMTHDFEDIEIKKDAAAILEDQLRRKRKPCMISTGSMSDPYIHLEEKLEITRQCLELIDKYGFGLAIHTKPSRILRDLDLLKRINARSKCVVQMTLREGNREYYYQKLDRWFPGLKARYVSHFGSSYACSSPNNEGLMNIFKKQYETKHAQMSLF
jgi:DNA repair photolyase